MSTQTSKPSTLSRLALKPIPEATLTQLRDAFQATTLPKLREDARRNALNVAHARSQVAYR